MSQAQPLSPRQLEQQLAAWQSQLAAQQQLPLTNAQIQALTLFQQQQQEQALAAAAAAAQPASPSSGSESGSGSDSSAAVSPSLSPPRTRSRTALSRAVSVTPTKPSIPQPEKERTRRIQAKTQALKNKYKTLPSSTTGYIQTSTRGNPTMNNIYAQATAQEVTQATGSNLTPAELIAQQERILYEIQHSSANSSTPLVPDLSANNSDSQQLSALLNALGSPSSPQPSPSSPPAIKPQPQRAPSMKSTVPPPPVSAQQATTPPPQVASGGLFSYLSSFTSVSSVVPQPAPSPPSQQAIPANNVPRSTSPVPRSTSPVNRIPSPAPSSGRGLSQPGSARSGSQPGRSPPISPSASPYLGAPSFHPDVEPIEDFGPGSDRSRVRRDSPSSATSSFALALGSWWNGRQVQGAIDVSPRLQPQSGRSPHLSPNTSPRMQPVKAVHEDHSQLEEWDEQLDRYPILHRLEESTGIRKVYIAIVAVIALIALIFFGVGTSFICSVVGFVYPVYRSFKAIETPELNELRQWVMYWVVYGLLTVLESISDRALSWIPFYFPVKLAFLLWCFLPQFQGANRVYQWFVHPVLATHEANIDQSIERAQRAASITANKLSRAVRHTSTDISNEIRQRLGSISRSPPVVRRISQAERVPGFF